MLDAATITAVAVAVADELDVRERHRTGWVDAAAVARHLCCDRTWVYEHANELGAIKLGNGPKAHIRFRLEEVDRNLTLCSGTRGSNAQPSTAHAARPR